jgi:hypothetical protein
VSNTLFALSYYVPSLSPVNCQMCLENLVEKHIVDGFIGARVSNVWCSYRFELFWFFSEYPILACPVVNQGDLLQ